MMNASLLTTTALILAVLVLSLSATHGASASTGAAHVQLLGQPRLVPNSYGIGKLQVKISVTPRTRREHRVATARSPYANYAYASGSPSSSSAVSTSTSSVNDAPQKYRIRVGLNTWYLVAGGVDANHRPLNHAVYRHRADMYTAEVKVKAGTLLTLELDDLPVRGDDSLRGTLAGGYQLVVHVSGDAGEHDDDDDDAGRTPSCRVTSRLFRMDEVRTSSEWPFHRVVRAVLARLLGRTWVRMRKVGESSEASRHAYALLYGGGDEHVYGVPREQCTMVERDGPALNEVWRAMPENKSRWIGVGIVAATTSGDASDDEQQQQQRYVVWEPPVIAVDVPEDPEDAYDTMTEEEEDIDDEPASPAPSLPNKSTPAFDTYVTTTPPAATLNTVPSPTSLVVWALRAIFRNADFKRIVNAAANKALLDVHPDRAIRLAGVGEFDGMSVEEVAAALTEKTQRINAIRDHFLNTPDLPAFLRQWDATAATHGFARDVQSTKNWYDYTLKMKAARVFWDGIVDADRV